MLRIGWPTRTTPAAAALAPLLVAALVAPATAGAVGLGAQVQDAEGAPVPDAVVYALRLDANGEPVELPPRAEIDQIDKEFVPTVTAVRVGTRVLFPNRDQIRHHVYSFSPAKTFEIPLYAGMPEKPILFDKPGPVVLGCNIHDWMRAWVFVVETPHFAVTGDDGRVGLALPPGDYSVRVWHPELAGDPEQKSQQAALREGSEGELRFVIERKRVWRPRRAPSIGGPGYH